MSHTPKTLEPHIGEDCTVFNDEHEEPAFTVRYRMDEALAQHIAATWNACSESNLPTSFLEQGGIARLVEALRFVNERCQLYGAADAAREKIDAALAGIPQRDNNESSTVTDVPVQSGDTG